MEADRGDPGLAKQRLGLFSGQPQGSQCNEACSFGTTPGKTRLNVDGQQVVYFPSVLPREGWAMAVLTQPGTKVRET